ncbi:competence protein CoiA [Companilactobacillus futsaii]|uniref:competence protein CoiA n=1 Tax=Companilactobacillus futsaii TaxID=938155 RepID=UPI00189EE74A|nr:competence protein CoiA family protein [Companilactobacillus futsaii]
MYAALNKSGILIYAQNAEEKEHYVCCRCAKPVKLITTKTRKYFRHLNKVNNDINERDIHLVGKEIILDLLKNFSDVKEEYFLPAIQQRPDIFLTDQKIAIEYQCALLKIDSLEERVLGYQQFGIKSIWILGGNYLDDQIHKKHLKFISYSAKLGYYIIMLDSKRKAFTIFHHIKFNGPFNRIFFQRQIFQEAELADILNFAPQNYRLNPVLMNQHFIHRLRQKNDRNSQQVKMDFFQHHQITVEDYLNNRYFVPIAPIYFYPAWQMACGQGKKLLRQPLLEFKTKKKPPD